MNSYLDKMFSLDGKLAIVTGAARGLGKAISEALAKAGATVVMVDMTEIELKNAFLDLRNQKLRVVKHVCDLTKKNSIKKLVNQYDKIDILVNNAGTTMGAPFFEYPEDFWDKTHNLNLKVPFLLSKRAATKMTEGGSIINITSLNAELAFPDNPAYVSSKGGLKQLSKSLALELGKFNIRVNNIGPGYMKTKMTSVNWQNPRIYEERCKKTVLDRWGEPEDLAGLVVFLSSDAASYITAQDVYVDGGWLAKGL